MFLLILVCFRRFLKQAGSGVRQLCKGPEHGQPEHGQPGVLRLPGQLEVHWLPSLP